MAALYGTFLDRVSRGRGITGERLDDVAQGRVWSGARARTLGLVDALGGPLEALREAARRAGVREDERVVIDVYPRRTPLPSIRSLLRFTPGRLATLP
jgi:ClpP class serine protease